LQSATDSRWRRSEKSLPTNYFFITLNLVSDYIDQMNLKHLTDKTLISETKKLVEQERKFTTTILHHLKEIERRKLFSEYGYSSMVHYAVKEFHYSESSAVRRIQAARMLADLPELEEKINDGSLTLSGISQAAGFFQREDIKEPEQKKEILEQIEGLTARDTERKLFELGKEPVLPPEFSRPVSATYTQVKMNVCDETLRLMENARQILGEYKFCDSYMEKLSKEALENINRKKYKLTDKGRETETTGRTPTNSQQRELYERGEGVCEKCGSLFKVQKDHRHPYALGGKTETSNLRLLCFHCNQRARIRAKL